MFELVIFLAVRGCAPKTIRFSQNSLVLFNELIISKKFMNNDNENLVYEDEMDEDELKKIDEELD